MIRQRIMDRPIVPESYLTALSGHSSRESSDMIGATPICISMEPVSMNIEDLIRDIDFGRARRRRSRGV